MKVSIHFGQLILISANGTQRNENIIQNSYANNGNNT